MQFSRRDNTKMTGGMVDSPQRVENERLVAFHVGTHHARDSGVGETSTASRGRMGAVFRLIGEVEILRKETAVVLREYGPHTRA